jgi:glycerophosphoryl diester phosphodiesterase
VQVIAHRGASAYEPEHTFAAYDLALAQGAHALELDVRATADGEVVVLHDPTLLRTHGDPRAIADVALGDLDTPPLTLDQVLGRYGRATRYQVELKDPRPEWEGRVAESIERHGLRARAGVMAFDTESLRRLRWIAPYLALTQLCDVPPDVEEVARYADALGPWHAIVTADLVDAAHRRGLAVRTWTADPVPEIKRLIGCGVDGVITNVPDVATALAERGAEPVLAS